MFFVWQKNNTFFPLVKKTDKVGETGICTFLQKFIVWQEFKYNAMVFDACFLLI